MPDFNYDDYVYFKENEEVPKIHHKVFIFVQESYFYITPPLKFWDFFISLLKLFVKKELEQWISNNIQVVNQLSKTDV